MKLIAGLVLVLSLALPGWGQARYVIADQDASTTADMALMLLLQSPEVRLLGITVVTGNSWRDEEVAHALRLVEGLGKTDVPVLAGAVFPLVRTAEETRLFDQLYGKPSFLGAYTAPNAPVGWDKVDPAALPEGPPKIHAGDENGAQFMVRMVHEHPHQVTIVALGPLTDVALACRLDPHFAELVQELVLMGCSLNPQTEAAEWVNRPRHEFNFWFDPEAAHIVLRAPWKKIVCTPTDISIKTHLTPALVKQIEASGTPLAHYLGRFAMFTPGADIMWDELAAAAWIDPTVITKRETRYMDVDLDRGAGYGNTLTWAEKDKPRFSKEPVEIPLALDLEKFYRMFVSLMSGPTAVAH
jgi:inosine-uridine nucleoside N-ribohydrolase